MRRIPFRLVIGVALIAIAVPPRAENPVEPPAPGSLVAIGDYRLHMKCAGIGTPTVILEAGLGGTSLEWTLVQAGVARHTKVCAYDRAGYGWSDGGPLPRTSEKLALELKALLRKANLEGPYVFVGHSFGAFTLRMYANYYPEEVAGVVLVDAAHEDQFDVYGSHNGMANSPVGGNFFLTSTPQIPDSLPDELRPQAAWLAHTYKTHRAMRGELAGFRVSARQVKRAGPFPEDAPTVVISRGKRVWSQTPQGETMERLWQALQDDLATRTPHARHVIATESGHFVHLDQPDIVIDAIVDVVATIRRSRRSSGARFVAQ